MNEQAWSYGRDWSALITIGDPLSLVGTFAGSKILRIRSGQSSLPRKGDTVYLIPDAPRRRDVRAYSIVRPWLAERMIPP
jgi:hypothetical protein